MQIIGFSGPPHSGKDSIADAIVERCRVTHPGVAYKKSLAAPMRRVGMSLLGFDPTDDAAYARLKEEPQELFNRTEISGDVFQMGFETHSNVCDNLRQFMIWISESAIKPRYGQDFWARLLYAEVKALGLEDAVILVPDFGFHSEVRFFEDAIGEDNVVTVRLTRDGCDFSKDSRRHVNSMFGLSVVNNGTIDEAASWILKELRNSRTFGWQL